MARVQRKHNIRKVLLTISIVFCSESQTSFCLIKSVRALVTQYSILQMRVNLVQKNEGFTIDVCHKIE